MRIQLLNKSKDGIAGELSFPINFHIQSEKAMRT